MRVSFTITAMVHCQGECEFDTENLSMFVKPVGISPVMTFSELDENLSKEDESRIKMAALHQLFVAAMNEVQSRLNMKMEQHTPINMNPPDGDFN